MRMMGVSVEGNRAGEDVHRALNVVRSGAAGFFVSIGIAVGEGVGCEVCAEGLTLSVDWICRATSESK